LSALDTFPTPEAAKQNGLQIGSLDTVHLTTFKNSCCPATDGSGSKSVERLMAEASVFVPTSPI
jgi:hypothetical protein